MDSVVFGLYLIRLYSYHQTLILYITFQDFNFSIKTIFLLAKLTKNNVHTFHAIPCRSKFFWQILDSTWLRPKLNTYKQFSFTLIVYSLH